MSPSVGNTKVIFPEELGTREGGKLGGNPPSENGIRAVVDTYTRDLETENEVISGTWEDSKVEA